MWQLYDDLDSDKISCLSCMFVNQSSSSKLYVLCTNYIALYQCCGCFLEVMLGVNKV